MTNETAKSVPFNVMLSPALRQRLSTLAAAREVPVSHMIRTALLAYLDHTEQKAPTCADGTPCLCPNRWSRPERIKMLDGKPPATEQPPHERTDPDQHLEGSEQ